MSVLPELIFGIIRNVLVAAIWIYALTIIFKICVSLWTIISLVRRMEWPNVTLKILQHPMFFRTIYDSEAFLSILYDVSQKYSTSGYETIYGIFGSNISLLTCSGDYAQAVLTSPHSMNKSDRYSPIRDAIGEALITVPASGYRATRKNIMPVFHKRMIASGTPLFNKHVLATASKLEKHVNQGEFVVETYVETYIFKCVTEFLLGVPMADDEIEKLIHLSHILTTNISKNIVRILKLPGFIHKITAEGRMNAKLAQELDPLLFEMIRRREDVLAERNEKLENKIESSTEENCATNKTLIDILMDPERKSGGNTLSEVKIFVEGAASTSIHTINAVLMMLARHPEEQRKVYEELCDIYGSTAPEDVPVDLSDHQRMHRLGRVIKEAMRLFPGIPLIARSVEEDIRIGDQTIPKGCEVSILIYGMHRSEKYWIDPLKFDPDRFLPENSRDRSPWVYLPFSEGPRKCPAYTMGLAMITQFLATTLRKYIISSDSIPLIENIKMKMKIAGSFIEPVKIKIQRRQPIGSIKSTARER